MLLAAFSVHLSWLLLLKTIRCPIPQKVMLTIPKFRKQMPIPHSAPQFRNAVLLYAKGAGWGFPDHPKTDFWAYTEGSRTLRSSFFCVQGVWGWS